MRQRRNIHLPLLAVVLALAGCASYQPRPIALAKTAATYQTRTLDDPGLRTFLRQNGVGAPGASARWDLRALTWVALYEQPDLAVARAKWHAAQAAMITAGARPNPTLDFTNQYDVDSPRGISPRTAGPTLNIPIETAGKRGDRIRLAQQLAEAARLNLANVAWQVRSRVRSSLLAVYPALPLLRQQQALQTQMVASMERRLILGEASQPELTQARITRDQFTLDVSEAQKQFAENRAKLASALGLPIKALDGIDLSFAILEQTPPVETVAPHEVQQQALLNRPDVRAALAEYEASQSALQLEVAKQYPDITLGPGFLWDAGEAKWSLGLSLVLPLLNHNQGPIAEARAKGQQAAANFIAVQAHAIGEVEQALAGYREARKKLVSADALLAQLQKQATSAEALFRAGETDRLTLLGAKVELAAAQLARARILLQAQQSLGALEDAVRQPLGIDAPNAHAIETDPRPQDTPQ